MLNTLTFSQLSYVVYGALGMSLLFLIVIICLSLSNRKIGKKNQELSKTIRKMQPQLENAKNNVAVENSEEFEKRIVKKSVETTLDILGVKY